jgi:tetratricopeptide (TPR) repeat protein
MRLIEGSLKDRLNDYAADPRAAAGLVATAARAVHHAHQRGILHRDHTPANILVDEQGQPHVTDFGLAKRVDAGSDLTPTGEFLGTAGYVAPEQALGPKGVTTAADIYGLGAILYELLTGRPPFKSDSFAETLRRTLERDPQQPRSLNPRVPRDLETICLKCLEKIPGKRYASAQEMAVELQLWLDGKPIPSRPVGSIGRGLRWVRRNPLAVALVMVLALGLTTSSASAWRAWIETARAEHNNRLKDEALQRLQSEKTRANELAVEAGETAREKTEALAKTREAERRAQIELQILVDVFKISDPIGFEGYGLGVGSRQGQLTTAREILERGAKRIDERDLVDKPLIRADLMATIGDVYRSLAMYDPAGDLLTRARDLRLKTLGDRHPDYAASLHSLAWLHQDQGDYDKAETLYRQALSIRRERLGVEDKSTIRTMFQLGWLLIVMERYDEAEPLLREVIAICDKRPGDGDRDGAFARGALAGLLVELGRFPEASVLSLRAVKAILAQGKDSRPFEAAWYIQEAIIHRRWGRRKKAEELLQKSRAIALQLLGHDHPYFALILHELAVTLESQNDLTGAERTYRECLDVVRRTVGIHHPRVIIPVSCLARLLARQDRYKDAEQLYLELLAARRNRFGSDHPLVAEALTRFAQLAKRHNADASERMAREAVAIFQKRKDCRPPLYVESLHMLARLFIDRNSLVDAEPLLREAVELARRRFGENHPRTTKMRGDLRNVVGTRKRGRN